MAGAKRPDKREQDRLRTRAAILDATEVIMRDEGYAAVTSRRVAERAGLKSQLVHYHFGSMDELFEELFRRSEKRFLAMHLAALKAPQPLAGLWALNTEAAGMDLVSEFVAAAQHRKGLQTALAATRERFRTLHATMLGDYFDAPDGMARGMSSKAFAFILSSVAVMLVEERRLGVSDGHDEVVSYMEGLISELAEARAARQADAS